MRLIPDLLHYAFLTLVRLKKETVEYSVAAPSDIINVGSAEEKHHKLTRPNLLESHSCVAVASRLPGAAR